MCEQHEKPGFTRRNFTGFLLGAAGVAAFPLRASAAAHVTALGLICIDYRLIDDAVRFFDGLKLNQDYDQVELAGASLAAVSRKFPSSNRAFWDHVDIAKSLHNIQKVIVVDHRDCGAYKVAFGRKFASEHDAETAQHKGVMLKTQAMMRRKHPDLTSEYYLMALDGTAERII